MDENRNSIVRAAFSSSLSGRMYECNWPDDPACRDLYENGFRCGGCSFCAAFDADWGLCANPRSRHHLETVFEHFTCPTFVNEGWGPHGFTEHAEFHCRCRGEPLDPSK